MKLYDLTIQDYKSLITPQRFDFRNHFTMLIGSNGSGKSNIIHAIADFFAFVNGEKRIDSGLYVLRVAISKEEWNSYFVNNPLTKKSLLLKITFADKNAQDIYIESEVLPKQKLDVFSDFGVALLNLLKKKYCLLDYEGCVFDKGRSLTLFHELFIDICIKNGWLKENTNLHTYSAHEISVIFDKFKKLIKKYDDFYDDLLEHLEFVKENNLIQCYVHDINGEKRRIVETNTGRRWLLFYYVMNQRLSTEDILLIDEPSAFLHPEAQLKVLSDMENLVEKRKLYVIYSTHSPYMVSSCYPSFCYVKMTKKGTHVSYHKIKDLPVVRDQMHFLDFNSILFNFNQIYILVEGQSDVACLKKFMAYFAVDQTKYRVLQIDGAGNMKMVTHFLSKNGISFIRVLDADQMQYYKNATDIVFVGKNSHEKRLEGLFSKSDRYRYFKGEKVSSEKVLKGKVFTKTTIENFRLLFEELGIL